MWLVYAVACLQFFAKCCPNSLLLAGHFVLCFSFFLKQWLLTGPTTVCLLVFKTGIHNQMQLWAPSLLYLLRPRVWQTLPHDPLWPFPSPGFEIIPVYLSISGNFRKWQVKNIDACRWRQARKTSIIHNLSIWIIFPSIFHQHACSLVQFIGVLARDSHSICGSYQTLLNKNEMMQSL